MAKVKEIAIFNNEKNISRSVKQSSNRSGAL